MFLFENNVCGLQIFLKVGTKSVMGHKMSMYAAAQIRKVLSRRQIIRLHCLVLVTEFRCPCDTIYKVKNHMNVLLNHVIYS